MPLIRTWDRQRLLPCAPDCCFFGLPLSDPTNFWKACCLSATVQTPWQCCWALVPSRPFHGEARSAAKDCKHRHGSRQPDVHMVHEEGRLFQKLPKIVGHRAQVRSMCCLNTSVFLSTLRAFARRAAMLPTEPEHFQHYLQSRHEYKAERKRLFFCGKM